MTWIYALAAGYLAGSIPFGLLVGKARGVDLRREGSGNIGASNCARVLGWRTGLLVFALDLGKGLFAALPWPSVPLQIAAGCAAVAGHCYPVWLRFAGGKGVATAAGVLLLLAPEALLAALGVWLLVAWRRRTASLASLTATVAFLGLAIGADLWLARPHRLARAACYAGLALLLLWRHRENIARLRAGKELQLR